MSTSATTPALRKTPLNAVHRQMGAKMVDFGGWDMPVEYSGLIAEHMAVRNGVGLFDVSHMGDIQLRGPESLAAIPAAIAYNAFGSRIREIGTRMDDFALEFLNMAERSFGE